MPEKTWQEEFADWVTTPNPLFVALKDMKITIPKEGWYGGDDLVDVLVYE